MSLTDLQLLFPDGPCMIMASSGPVRCALMTGAVSLLPKGVERPSVLEIGSFTGISAMSFGYGISLFYENGGRLTCIDPWDAPSGKPNVPDEPKPLFEGPHLQRIMSMLEGGQIYDMFLHNMRTISKRVEVTPFRGHSATVLPMLQSEQFDLIFIDGDHSYEGCRNDIEQAKRLLKDGGIMCGDDLDLELHQCDADFARRMSASPNQYFDPRTSRNFHPGVTVAVAETLPAVTNVFGFWAVRKRGNRYEPLSLAGARLVVPPFFSEGQRAEARTVLQKTLVNLAPSAA